MSTSAPDAQLPPAARGEARQRVRLAEDSGRWNAAAGGWSRFPLHICNLHGAWPRKKAWNLWRIRTRAHLFSIGLADLDHSGLVFASLYDGSTGEFYAVRRWLPLSRGVDLGMRAADAVRLSRRDLGLSFQIEKGILRVRADLPWRGGGRLRADLDLSAPEDLESLSTAAAWNPRRYACRTQFPLWSARGEILAGRERLEPGRNASEAALAWGEFGRGRLPRRQRILQAQAMGRSGDRPLALHFASGWPGADQEHAAWLDGKLHPFPEAVAMQFDPDNYRLPWLLRTDKSDAVDLIFTPEYERAARVGGLFVRGEARQIFGRFRGRIRIGARKLDIDDLFGWTGDRKSVV